MKFRDLKKTLKNEEYNIPDVLQKIKANLPEVMPKNVVYQKQIPRLRYAFNFLCLLFLILFVFTSITFNQTKAEISGPVELNYFTSQTDITNTILKNQKLKNLYINQSQIFFDHYTMEDIDVKKIYDFANQNAIYVNNKIYYLNNDGIVVYDVASDLKTIYKEDLKFDEKTNVKTLYLVNGYLVVIYNNKQYTYIIKYDAHTMQVLFTYTIAATFVSSTIYKNKLFVVSILNNTVLPFIKVNEVWKKIEPTDIGYLDNVMGESYTIITSIDLYTNAHNETIFLSFNKWDIIYFYEDRLYLISNHMNYSKTLDYGEYTTILKFKNIANSFNYYGSYTIKGTIQNNDSVIEVNDNFRAVIEVTHYNIKTFLLFFKKVVEVKRTINVVNLRSSTINGVNIFEITSNYEISGDDTLDNSISILTTQFTNDQVIIATKDPEPKVISLIFENDNIRPFTIHTQKKLYPHINKLDTNFGFTLKAIKTSTGNYELKFYEDLSTNPTEIMELTIPLSYSIILNNADYTIIEAINNPNAYFKYVDDFYYYLGFSTTNNLKNNGIYTLIRIDKIYQTYIVIMFESDEFIEKILSSDAKTIYALSNNSIIRYTSNEDSLYNFSDCLSIR